MTPKEQAKELVYKYYNTMNPNAPDCNISFNQAKKCALIAVDLALSTCVESRIYYLIEVKKEIEKL